MSELGLPAEDKENSGETDGRKQKIKYDWCEHFRFQPIRFCQSLLAQTDRQISCGEQVSKRRRLLNRVRRLLASDPIGSILIGVAFILALYLLYCAGFFKPNSITAIATVVLAIWAAIQLIIYNGQLKAMEKQLELTERQLKQTELASGQTSEVIEHMRHEQRAWLAVTLSAHQSNLEGDDPIRLNLSVQVRNSGRSPAVITRFLVDFMWNGEPTIMEIERRARASAHRRIMVSPDDIFTFSIHENANPPQPNKSTRDAMRRGDIDAYLVGGFIYDDPFGTERKTICIYKWIKAFPGFPDHPSDSDAT